MRVIGEIPHTKYKITLFHWNNKYILKFEIGLCEQTYKFSEMDISGVDEVKAAVNNEAFMKKVEEIFDQKHASLNQNIG
jgi:hypothetical protein